MAGKSSESESAVFLIVEVRLQICWQGSGEPPLGGVVNRPPVPLSVKGGVNDVTESTSCHCFKRTSLLDELIERRSEMR